MAEVKFCENNFSYGVEDLIKRIEEELDGVSLDVEPCLGYCGDCAEGPFALVDNELIQADSPEELYDEIKLIIEK